jgi:hypothetical protein
MKSYEPLKKKRKQPRIPISGMIQRKLRSNFEKFPALNPGQNPLQKWKLPLKI